MHATSKAMHAVRASCRGLVRRMGDSSETKLLLLNAVRSQAADPARRSIRPESRRTNQYNVKSRLYASSSVGASSGPQHPALEEGHHTHHPSAAPVHRIHPAAPNVDGLVMQLYRSKLSSGEISPDPKQEETMKWLQHVCDEYVEYDKQMESYVEPSAERSAGLLSSWMGKFGIGARASAAEDSNRPRAPRGFYMYGDVGCGKTMLMDMFLDALPISKKKRVHFNSFMQQFHDSIHKWRSSPKVKSQQQSDALDFITDNIIQEGRLLCFDEFQVTNIADAMMLGRLFTFIRMLWKKGAVVIATSNRPPDDLYKGGLQRDLFVPFIHELKHHCCVHYINSDTDYRLIGERAGNVYIQVPSSSNRPSTDALRDVWNRLTENRTGSPLELSIRGRKIHVPESAKGIAMFHFSDLCEKALGPADYTLIAQTFHTILVGAVPKMNLTQANEARRFITLVDELYEHHVKLICTAEVPPNELFPSKLDAASADHAAAEEEIFAFSRTVSRLMEMQTSEYLQSRHTPNPHQRHEHSKPRRPSRK